MTNGGEIEDDEEVLSIKGERSKAERMRWKE